MVEPKPNAADAAFDRRKDLQIVKISCVPERMLFSVNQFAVTVGQPVKLSRTPASVRSTTPAEGEHTDAILDALGYGPADVARLRACGAV